MTEEQIEQCKQQLLKLQKEQQILERENAKSSNTSMPDQSNAGRLSRIQAMQGQQAILEASRRNEMRTEEIEGSLRRIQSGEYGYCFYCEEAIDANLLKEDPTIARCAKCVDYDIL